MYVAELRGEDRARRHNLGTYQHKVIIEAMVNDDCEQVYGGKKGRLRIRL